MNRPVFADLCFVWDMYVRKGLEGWMVLETTPRVVCEDFESSAFCYYKVYVLQRLRQRYYNEYGVKPVLLFL